jgi:DNA topoisomerase I
MQPPSRQEARRAAFVGPAAGVALALRRLANPLLRRARNLPTNSFGGAAGAYMSALVIVESPAKAATIQRFLPADEYMVRSCVGHVRELPSSAKRIPAKYKDLPWSRLGIDVDNGFAPLYVLIAGKQKIVNELKAALRDCDELILATDEDREGEAISWHLVQVLKPTVPIRRAVFHEITLDAIVAGIAAGRDIDHNLVQAQETRRILDRLAGYTMSPLLWKKIARGLSAGRVQSVALAVIVRRELERLSFVPAEYSDASAVFTLVSSTDGHPQSISAALVAVDGNRIARSSDFDPETGKLYASAASKGVVVLSKTDVSSLLDSVSSAIVGGVQKSRVKKNPPSPFITSTYQQEAGNKLGMSASRAMRVAQKLYENGHITYMRTDNPGLSEQAEGAARAAVVDRYGTDYLAGADAKPVKQPKGAQAAHEAIRPAGTAFVSPENMTLEDSDEKSVYALIYRRTLASQMALAQYDTTTITIDVELSGGDMAAAVFRATGRVIVFAGYLRAYDEARESSENDSDVDVGQSSLDLPDVGDGDRLLFSSGVAAPHKTTPRARYTDASLVKELEVLGVGRPSTYASIIEKLVERTYVFRGSSLKASDDKSGVSPRALVPSLTAFAVDNLLSTHFPEFVDAGFTAKMEAALDAIAAGGSDGKSYLTDYYHGESGLAAIVERNEKEIDNFAFRKIALPNMPGGSNESKASAKSSRKPMLAGAASMSAFDSSGEPDIVWKDVDVLVGPHGPYVEHNGSVVASLPINIIADELSKDRLLNVLHLAKDPVLGDDPVTGVPILVKTSKFGPYVQYGRDDDVPEGQKPRRHGLLRGMNVGELTVELALKLLSLPRTLGLHPVTGMEIKAGVGPYGSYVMHVMPDSEAPKYANLKPHEYDVLEIQFDEALALLNENEERREKRRIAQEAKAAAAAAEEADNPVKAKAAAERRATRAAKAAFAAEAAAEKAPGRKAVALTAAAKKKISTAANVGAFQKDKISVPRSSKAAGVSAAGDIAEKPSRKRSVPARKTTASAKSTAGTKTPALTSRSTKTSESSSVDV